MIGIYKIYCVSTNEFYIGSSINIAARKAGHLYKLRNNIHANPILQNKYNTYGENSFHFSIIEECKKEDLLKREQHYIDTLRPILNINLVAGRPPKIKWTKKSKLKMSISKKGIPHKNKRIYSIEGLVKIKNRNKILFSQGKLGGVGSLHPLAILNENKVIEIKELIEENILWLSDIADLYSVTYATIIDIKYNRSWCHLRPTNSVNSRSKLRSLTQEQRLSKSQVHKKYFTNDT